MDPKCSHSPPTVSILSQINAVHISVRPILILCSHLSLGPPSFLFPPGLPTNTPYVFPFSPYVPHSPPISSSSDYHSSILCGWQTMKLLTVQFSPFSCCLLLLPPTPPCFPQHLLLEHPQCDRPSFIPYKTRVKITVLFSLLKVAVRGRSKGVHVFAKDNFSWSSSCGNNVPIGDQWPWQWQQYRLNPSDE